MQQGSVGEGLFYQFNSGGGSGITIGRAEASLCEVMFAGRGCPTWRELWWNILFTSEGVMLTTVLSFALLIAFRVFGPQEADERSQEIGRMWKAHERRFPRKEVRPLNLHDDSNSIMGRLELKKVSIDSPQPTERIGSAPCGCTRRREVFIDTAPGPTRVTIIENERGDDSFQGLPLLLLHDVCQNSNTCFSTLLGAASSDPMLSRSTVYLVDVPGHEEGGNDVGPGALSLEGLANELTRIVSELGLGLNSKQRFVGVGAGAGANILLRYACDHPDRVAGLYLISPMIGAPDWRERNLWRWVQSQLWMTSGSGAVNHGGASALAEWLFSGGSRPAQRKSERALCMMQASCLGKYVQACLDRDVLPDSRLASLRGVPVSLVYADEGEGGGYLAGSLVRSVSGVDHCAAAESLFGAMGSPSATCVTVKLKRGGRLPTETCTGEALQALKELLVRAQ